MGNKEIRVVKKNGTTEIYDPIKIIKAIHKSAQRVSIELSEEVKQSVVSYVSKQIGDLHRVTVHEIHGHVEKALDIYSPHVAKSYKDYRNYKEEFVYSTMEEIERKVHDMLTGVDRSNSNSNTRYNSTKRTEIAKAFASEMYQKMFLPLHVIQALKDGYIYIHDLSDMLIKQFNCCLTDYKTILEGGFSLENLKYTEPKDIKVAVGQMGDILQIISAQHFGGHTVPQVEKVLSKYYKLTIEKEITDIRSVANQLGNGCLFDMDRVINLATKKAYREMKQGIQGFEMKMNTVVSARGSYPFSTLTFGDVSDDFEADVCKAILEVRMEGHGDKGFKKNVIFPKLVFLYNPEIHGEGKRYRWLFELAIKCSSKCMYPDFLSPKLHKREGKWVSPIKY